jgi:hypothetical protein
MPKRVVLPVVAVAAAHLLALAVGILLADAHPLGWARTASYLAAMISAASAGILLGIWAGLGSGPPALRAIVAGAGVLLSAALLQWCRLESFAALCDLVTLALFGTVLTPADSTELLWLLGLALGPALTIALVLAVLRRFRGLRFADERALERWGRSRQLSWIDLLAAAIAGVVVLGVLSAFAGPWHAAVGVDAEHFNATQWSPTAFAIEVTLVFVLSHGAIAAAALAATLGRMLSAGRVGVAAVASAAISFALLSFLHDAYGPTFELPASVGLGDFIGLVGPIVPVAATLLVFRRWCGLRVAWGEAAGRPRRGG